EAVEADLVTGWSEIGDGHLFLGIDFAGAVDLRSEVVEGGEGDLGSGRTAFARGMQSEQERPARRDRDVDPSQGRSDADLRAAEIRRLGEHGFSTVAADGAGSSQDIRAGGDTFEREAAVITSGSDGRGNGGLIDGD